MSKTILAEVEGFTPIIDEVLNAVGLSAAAVFGRVWRYCQMENGVCYASLKTIGDGLGLSKPTIIKYLGLLVSAGYLEDTTPGNEGSPHVYRDTGKAGMRISFTAGSQNSLPGESKIFTGRSQNSLPKDSIKKEEKETTPVTYPEQPETLTRQRLTDAKVKGDLVDLMIELQANKPLAERVKESVKEKLNKTPVWDRPANREWLSWAVGQGESFFERLDSFMKWWRRSDWRGMKGDIPSFDQIRELWPNILPKPIPDGYRPGIDPNPSTGFVDFVPGVSQL
ncbi:MAG: helix-turn-helix domain-containing protein [Methanoregulaceae archaeon]|nr:helix-turn-helix domain-containing protein [Methanoregulaceae archaeon]